MPSIGVPTYVVSGSRDRVTPPRLSRALADDIPGARLITIPGAGHQLPLEAPADVAELLVSELATNALRYGRPPFEVRVRVAGDAVEVGVSDTDPAVPMVLHDRSLEESGRGLRLVAQLAADWGIRTHEPGKTVWFSIRRDAGGSGPT